MYAEHLPDDRCDEIVSAIMSARTITAAAKRLGVTRVTLHRYILDSRVVAGLTAAREALVRRNAQLLENAYAVAINTLWSVANDKSDKVPAHRARAALALVNHVLAVRDRESVGDRIARLESLAAVGNDPLPE